MIRRLLRKISAIISNKCFNKSLTESDTMVTEHELHGHEEFSKFIENLNKGEIYFFLFTGSKDEHGKSWCPDCVEADPVILKGLTKAPQDSHFIVVYVGDRKSFKDSNCPFRKDPKTRLLQIPTLIRWNGPQRLEGEQCAKIELVEMFFTDEDDD